MIGAVPGTNSTYWPPCKVWRTVISRGFMSCWSAPTGGLTATGSTACSGDPRQWRSQSMTAF